jgi:hypothetical protein
MIDQKFGVGDIVTDGKFVMKVVMPFLDEDDSWWYECDAVEFDAPYTREIQQEKLTAYTGALDD